MQSFKELLVGLIALCSAIAFGMHPASANSSADPVHPSRNVTESSESIAVRGKLVNLERPVDGTPLFSSLSQQDEFEFTTPDDWLLGRGADHRGDSASDGSRRARLFLPRLRNVAHAPYTSYRQEETSFGYLPGSGDDLGWIDLESNHYLASGYGSGFSTGVGFQFLAGPAVVDAPPRLYNFNLGYQRRKPIGETFSYDVAASLGIYSDFEGSAREGVRFPGHAVGILHATPNTDWVFGMDYLDRKDTRILPVFGASHRSDRLPNWRFDLVFPRPQVEYSLRSGRTLYVSGSLGGGTWDIEHPSGAGDVMTYRDYRLMLGLKRAQGSHRANIEVGYAFDRKMSFEHHIGTAEPGGAFLFRMVTRR